MSSLTSSSPRPTGFLNTVRYVEAIRKRLSPGTRTTINEIGSISADDLGQGAPGYVFKPIPGSYWNLAGAMYAYLFGEMTRLGIDVAGESQLVGYPTQFPSVSMVDWTNGKPNPRYWVLKLLKDNFGPGDKLVETKLDDPYVYSMGVIKPDGKKRLLLVNKRDRDVELLVPGARERPGRLRGRDDEVRSTELAEAGGGQDHAPRAGGGGGDAAVDGASIVKLGGRHVG